jgi:uroporphyrinogen decarboxylase
VPTFEWDIDQKVIQALCPGGDTFDFVDVMGLDAVVISPNYWTEQTGEDLLKDEWGVVRKKGYEEYPIPLEEHAPIRTKSELLSYKPPDPVTSSRFSNLSKAVDRFKGKKAIIMKIRDVFSTPRDLRGYTRLLMDTKLDPQFVKDLAILSMEHNLEVGKESIRLGAEIIVTGDDYADNSGTIMSPKSFYDIFFPYFQTLVQSIKQAGAYFIKHTDGNIMSIIDMLVGSGIDCIDPIDPISGMDIAEIKKKFEGKIAIKGNINCATTLTSGSLEEVIREVKLCILKASIHGGHIISSSNSIHSGVKPLNYRTMLEIVQEYGTYPIDTEKIKKECYSTT